MPPASLPPSSLRSLRLKVLGAIALTIIGLLLLLFLPLRRIILDNFARLEQEAMVTRLQQFQASLAASEDALARGVHDYATWDEAYTFAQTGAGSFATSTFVDSTYTGLDVQLIAILDRSGSVLYAQTYNPASGTVAPIPENFLDTYGSRLRELPNPTSSITGLARVQDAVMLVAAQPIVTTEGKGPIEGTFIMGRTLSQPLVEQLQDETLIQASITSLSAPSALSQFEASALQELKSGASMAIRTPDDRQIQGYALLNSLQDQPLGLLAVTSDRPILAQARQTLRYTMLAVVGGALILGIVMMIVLQRLVLNRILRQHAVMLELTASPERALRLPAHGRDEIDALSASINATLDAIAHVQQRQYATEQQREQLQQTLIATQNATLAQLSTPLIPVTEQILVLPLIGSLDAARAERILSTTLHGIKAQQAKVTIIDLTGLEMVDAMVPLLLNQLAQASHIIGARMILTGIRADVARTLIDYSTTLTRIPAFTTLQQGITAAMALVEDTRGTW